MNYPKPAFMIEGELSSLSPVQTMVKMFEYTDKEGYLSIPEWPYDDKDYDEPDMYYLCKMNWSQEDLKNVIEDFQKLEERIKTIKDEDPLQSIIRENRDLVPFSDMQPEISDLIVLKEAKRPATYNVAIRAVRLCMLYATDAPVVIINNEAQLLAQALVINHFAESVKPFNCFDTAFYETGDELELVEADLTWNEIGYCDTLVRAIFGPANYVIEYSRELLDQIEENVSSLLPDEKDVIEKLFRDRESLELFAAAEGIDPEEAEGRKSTALRRLRHPRNSRKLKPFVHYMEEENGL